MEARLPKVMLPQASLPKCGVPWCGWQRVKKVEGTAIPPEPVPEDTYLLENAFLLSDGGVLLASDGKPMVYSDVTGNAAKSSVKASAYRKGMKLYKGKVYTQGGVNYECFRSSGNKVYTDLKDLSIYVNELKE